MHGCEEVYGIVESVSLFCVTLSFISISTNTTTNVQLQQEINMITDIIMFMDL
jgi:hypothetical protein